MKLSMTNGKAGTASPWARSAFVWGTANGFVPYGQSRPVQRAPQQQVVYVMRPADAAMGEDAEDAVACLVQLGLQRRIAADGVRRAVAAGISDTAEIVTWVCRVP